MRKLSEIENEDALDLLADIIDPTIKILADSDVKEMRENNKPKLLIAKHLVKSHKEPVLQILSALNGVPRSEYKCNVFTIVKDLLDILNDEALIGFFRSQEQEMMGVESSGSAMANTEETEIK